MDRGAWHAIVHGVAKELDMTQWLSNKAVPYHLTQVVTMTSILTKISGTDAQPTRAMEMVREYDLPRGNTTEAT